MSCGQLRLSHRLVLYKIIKMKSISNIINNLNGHNLKGVQSCTGYNDRDLVVHHRLNFVFYDICNLYSYHLDTIPHSRGFLVTLATEFSGRFSK